MTDLIKVQGEDGEEYRIPVAAMHAIGQRYRHNHQLELEAYKVRIAQLENALQDMLDRYATGFNEHDKEAKRARELLGQATDE